MKLISFLFDLGPFEGIPVVTVEDANEHLKDGKYILYPNGKYFGYDYGIDEFLGCIENEEFFPPLAKEWLNRKVLCIEPVTNHADKDDEANYLLIVLEKEDGDEEELKQLTKAPFLMQ